MLKCGGEARLLDEARIETEKKGKGQNDDNDESNRGHEQRFADERKGHPKKSTIC